MSADSPNIGLRLTGDPSGLQNALQQGGAAVTQFGRQAEQTMNAVGMSAKQTAFALRGVPAQFTDIFTSLQGGQKPMTVLLQQGGQLKDMFGGIGPAARAMGGYIMGMVTPFTLGAAAIAGLTYGAIQGAKELREFQNATTMTGNAVGVSATQFTAMRDSLAGIAGTRGKAAEVLAGIAENGKLAGASVMGIAEAAIQMERATGQAVEKTIKQFVDLAEKPTEASAKANESLNYLTAGLYAQIKALEEQGKKTEAAGLAIRALADTTANRAASIVDSAGLIEKSWNGVIKVLKQVGDATMNIGRQQSLGQQLAVVQGEIAAASGQDKNRQFRMPWDESLESLKQREGYLQENIRLEKRGAEAAAERAAATKAYVDWDKQGDEFKQKSAKRDEEIRKAEIEGRDLINKGLITEKDLRGRIADIQEKYKESGAAGVGQNEVARIQARIQEQKEYLERLKQQIARPIGAPKEDVKLTEGEDLVIKINKELATSITGVARAEKERALAFALELAGIDKGIPAFERQLKGVDAASEAYDKLVESVGKEADKIREQAAGQEAVNENFGKSKTAIEAATLAQLKLQLAEAEGGRFRDSYVSALKDKTEQQLRFVEALRQTEYKQAALKLTEAGRVAGEETQTLELELSLMGQTGEVRARIIAQRQIEVKLAKELADIEKLTTSDANKEELRAQARANAVVEASNAANKAVLDEWQRTADSINSSLTDALLRGFEAGKDAAANFRDTLVNMFKTLVLRPVISAFMSPLSMGINSIVQPIVGGITNAMGLTNAASSAANLYTNGLTAPGGAYYNFATSSAGQSLGLSNAAAIAGNNPSAYAPAGTQLTAGGLAPYAAILAPVFAAFADGFFSGEKRGGAQYGYSFDGTSVANARRGTTQSASGVGATFLEGPSGGDPAAEASKLVVNSTVASINAALQALGSQLTLTGYQAAYETSNAGKGGVFAGGAFNTGVSFGESGRGSSDPNAIGEADPNKSLYEMWGVRRDPMTGSYTGMDTNGSPEKLALDAAQSFIEAIQASVGIIPKIIAEKFNYTTVASAEQGTTDTQEGTRYLRVYDDAMRQSVQALGLLPKRIMDLILDVDPEALSDAATKDLATKIQTMVTNVNGFRAIVDALPVASLKGVSFDVAASLVEASGGLQAFDAAFSGYSENFYSEAERTANTSRLISAELAKVNLTMPATREEFRAMVDASVGLGEAGAPAAAALLRVQGAFASIVPAAEAAAAATASFGAVRNAIQEVAHSIASMRTGTEAAAAGITSARSDVLSAYNAAQGRVNAAQSALNSLMDQSAQSTRAFGRTLSDYLLGLKTSTQSALDPESRYQMLGAELQSTSVLARGGDQASRDKIPGLLDAYLGAARERSGSSLDYAREEARVRTMVQELIQSLPALAPEQTTAQQITAATNALTAAQAEQARYAALAAETGTSILASTDLVGDEIRGLREAYIAAAAEQTAANLRLDVALAALDALGLSESMLAALTAGQTGQAPGDFAFALGVSDDTILAIQHAMGLSDADLQALSDAMNVQVAPEVYAALGSALGAPSDLIASLGGSLGVPADLIAMLAGGLGVSPIEMIAMQSALGLNADTALALQTILGVDPAQRAAWATGLGIDPAALAPLGTALGWDAQQLQTLGTAIGLAETTVAAMQAMGTLLGFSGAAQATIGALSEQVGISPFARSIIDSLGASVGIGAADLAVIGSLGTSVGLQTGILGSLGSAIGLSGEARAAVAGLQALMSGTATAGYYAANPDVAAAYQQDTYGLSRDQFAFQHYAKYGQAEGRLDPVSYLPKFAAGTNALDRDMALFAHAGEEIKPRAYVDMDRDARDQTNSLLAQLLESNAKLREEVASLRKSAQGTEETLDGVVRGRFTLKVEAPAL